MDISVVAAALHSRLPELGERIARRIRTDVDAYEDEALLPFDSLRRSCTANADLILSHLGTGGAPDPSPARETGRIRAEQGVPLADTLHAYRVGFELLWTEILTEARTHPEVSGDRLVSESAAIWALFGLYAEAVAAAYRETAAELTARGRPGARRWWRPCSPGSSPTAPRCGRPPASWACPSAGPTRSSRRRPAPR
ncbi:hypothetical protein [Streptomyces stelliscabiei]|uniref:hypothetical protein n=1 Tax=Streptomyces stelliscabiei TaxID=146820 RepID=UPI003A90B153